MRKSTYSGKVLNDVKSAGSLEVEVEAIVSDAGVSVEFDGCGASSDEHALREACVANVYEIRSPLAAFLLIGASSFSVGGIVIRGIVIMI